MFSVQSIVFPWDDAARYALNLLEDLSDEQMVLRPGGNMNHPAWILGHLCIYHPIVPALLNGEPFDDPAEDSLFGFRGRGPQVDPVVYGSKQAQVDRYVEGHETVAQALLNATVDQLQRAPSLARWSKMFPSVEFMLPDLLLHHESIHIGQLSIWRRAAGLPPVEVPEPTFRDGLLG